MKTALEILEKHCPFKNVSGNTEYFTKEVLEAMQDFAAQSHTAYVTDEVIEDLKNMSNNYIVCLQSYVIPKSVLDMYIEHLESRQAALSRMPDEGWVELDKVKDFFFYKADMNNNSWVRFKKEDITNFLNKQI